MTTDVLQGTKQAETTMTTVEVS